MVPATLSTLRPGAHFGPLERLILRWPRLGATDIFHANVARRGLAGKLYILVCGTPHLGTFANGYYLRRALRQVTFRTVLDAGCGDGTFAFYVARKHPHCRVLGVDVGEQGTHDSGDTLEVCERTHEKLRIPNLEFQRMDLRELDAKERFDFIYSFDVLEHIAENRSVLERLYRALSPGGSLLVRIPARVQKRILSERFTAEHAKWAAIEHVGQHYTMESLIADLRDIGFRIRSAEYTMGFWGRLSFELNEALRYVRVPEAVRFALVPLLRVLRFVDVQTKVPPSGDGLLVLCSKDHAATPDPVVADIL
jgi:SAM-dependent methyltransferase